MRRLKLPLIAAAALCLTGCVKFTLAWADLKPDGEAATPEALGAFGVAAPVETSADWQNRIDLYRDELERHVFGVMPDATDVDVIDRELLDDAAFGGRGRLEQWTLSATATFNGVAVSTQKVGPHDGFLIQLLTPTNAKGSVPVILMQTFCPSWDVIPHPEVWRPEDANSMSGGIIGGIATYVFGRYICTPPIEMILDEGYAIASIYPGAVIPDRREEGLAELKRLSAGLDADGERWGAIAAWGWLFSSVATALEEDARFDQEGFILWGHSRYGKAALLAAAFDERIDGVVSHQSGTGGASLNRRKKGESIAAITDTYPHWFAESYAAFAGREEEMPIDQHHLLALIAPRPVLLGNARRDVWSDPNGAFRAALGADPVYELLGAGGVEQERLDEWRPEAALAFWIRPGTHGVVKEDWPAFLEFLGAHFARGES